MTLNRLTDAKIRNTKPPMKGEVMLADGGGLYAILRTDGSCFWQFHYRYDGRKRKRGLGAYPAVKLAAARAAAAECRAQLAQGVSPVEAAERARSERQAAAQRGAGRPTVRALFTTGGKTAWLTGKTAARASCEHSRRTCSPGSATLGCTPPRPARWATRSIVCSRNTFSSAAPSFKSQFTNGARPSESAAARFARFSPGS